MPLSHDELREIILRRSQEDLKTLIDFAVETIGEPPVRENIIDEEGNIVEENAHLLDK